MISNPSETELAVGGSEHWVGSGTSRIFIWEKRSKLPQSSGAIVFVHGSSAASIPCFDLQVPGGVYTSPMDWFSAQGFDTYCFDCRGYGRSYKGDEVLSSVVDGADDLLAVTTYLKDMGIGRVHLYGVSSGALRAGVFAMRFPERVDRIALDSFVWTGHGSVTLAQRKKKMHEWKGQTRRALDERSISAIMSRDGVDSTHPDVAKALIRSVLAFDASIPNGTYIDMCENLPLVDPKKLTNPVLITRGQHDGIATDNDIVSFFENLSTSDKELVFLPGVSHGSMTQKTFLRTYHVLYSFLTRPE